MPLNIVPAIVPGDLGASAYMNLYLRDNMNALIALVGSQNLLVNPGFEVYQRGANVPANNLAYLVDRWQIILGSGSSTFDNVETTTVDANSAASLLLNYTHSAVSRLDQKVEDFRGLQGKTITFAIRVRSSVVGSVRPYINDSGTYTYGAAIAATGAFQTLTVTATISGAASAVTVGIELSATAVVYVDNAVLAYGALAPAYVPLHPQVDLARCQRYYQRITLTARFYNVIVASAQTFPFAYPVTMGGTPTATLAADGTVTNFWSQGIVAYPGSAAYTLGSNSPAGSEISVTGRTLIIEWAP